MQGYFLFIIILLAGAVLLSLFLKCDITFSIPLVIHLMVLCLFLTGYAGKLNWGVFIILGAEAAGLLYSLKKRLLHKKAFECLLSPGVIYFIICAAALWVINIGRYMNSFDDLYHWGLVIKNMLYYDRFAVADSMSVTYTTYPQASALPSYIALKLQGGWNEQLVFCTQALWCMSLTLKAFQKVRWKFWLQTIVTAVIMGSLPLIWSFRYTAYNTLGVDTLLAMIFAYLLVLCILEEKGFAKELAFWSGLAVLVLVKETGLFLAMFVIIFHTAIEMRDRSRKKRTVLLKSFACAAFSYLISCSWNVYLAFEHAFISKTAASRFSPELLWEILKGQADSVYGQTIKNAVHRITDLKLLRFGWNQSYLVWLLVIAAAVAAVVYLKPNGKNKTKTGICSMLLILVGAFLWWLGVMYVTLFQFSTYEMEILSSYDRYMSQYFLGILFTLCIVFLVYAGEKTGRIYGISSLCALSVVILFAGRPILSNIKFLLTSGEATLDFRQQDSSLYGAAILEELVPGIDRVYLIAQDDGPVLPDYYKAVYELSPVSVNRQSSFNERNDRRRSFVLGEKDSPEDDNTTSYTKSEFASVLKDYTYVCILSCDADFIESYGELFDGEVSEGWFYKVVIKNSELRLVKYRAF